MGKFNVIVDVDEHSSGECKISVTHNGYQWLTVSELTKEELQKIEDAIHVFLWVNAVDDDFARDTQKASWDCSHCDNAEIGGAFKECPNCGYAR